MSTNPISASIGHINWIKYGTDGVAAGDNKPHAYTLPNRPKPIKAE